MNYYFIDFENVNSQGLEGIEDLNSDDCVIIFYSANANSMTFEMHNKINISKADIVFEKVNVGKKNALDFQLASYIGYVIGRNEGTDAAYHLVTKDSEFSVIGKFWQRKYKTFSVIERIAKKAAEPEEALEMRLAAVLSDKTEIPVIVKIIRQYKTKQGINNALMKKFPSQNNQKASEIYKSIKPLIADKKGN